MTLRKTQCPIKPTSKSAKSNLINNLLGDVDSTQLPRIMTQRQLFWLHIKKSAGISTRSLLQPYYKEVDRTKKPKTFIQATPQEYNDILNNYRVVLGEYQFKRCLFAKKYLYPKAWDDMYSFAFSRDPTDRCVSMFFYLFWEDYGVIKNVARSAKKSLRFKKLINYNIAYAFDVFLDYAHQARISDSIYRPIDNHFTTHTAPMWDDITDFNGRILLNRVCRLEKLVEGINLAFEECGISKKIDASFERQLNKNKSRLDYVPRESQQKKIEEIYRKDFDIYEQAWH